MADQDTPDFVVGAGAPPAPNVPRRPVTSQMITWAIVLGALLGPALVAFVIRYVTSSDPWAPEFGFFVLTLLGLLAAGWATDRAGKFRRQPGQVMHSGEPEREADFEALALGFIVLGEAAAAAASEPWLGLVLIGGLGAWAIFCTVTPERRLQTGWILDVAASPQAVFEFMANPRNMPRWQPRETFLEPVPDRLFVGAVLHARTTTRGGLTVESDALCDELVPGRRFAFSTVDAFQSRGVISVDPAPPGPGTRITYSYRGVRNLTTMMVGRGFTNSAVRPEIEASYREQLALLKPLLEALPSASV